MCAMVGAVVLAAGASSRFGSPKQRLLLAPEAIERVVEAWKGGAGTVVAASYGGIRGHPVVLDRGIWAQIPDEGARAFEPVLIPCDDLGAPGDVDVPEDLPGRVGDAGAE